MKLKAILSNVLVVIALLVTPLIGICQPPPPNDDGGIPEVPFDSNLNLILLTVGILFAVAITVKQLRKKSATA